MNEQRFLATNHAHIKYKDLLKEVPNASLTHFIQKEKSTKKRITFFRKDNNSTTQNDQETVEHARNFYKNLYTSENPIKRSTNTILKQTGTKLNNNQRKFLEKPFTYEEIEKAINQTPPKSPGPSGLTIGFYKKFKKELIPILKDIANEMMRNGNTPEKMNETIITLIPKDNKDHTQIKNVRPISLLEIHRKIITRAANNRLKTVLKESPIINKFQMCHPERNIIENITTLNLIANIAKIKNKK